MKVKQLCTLGNNNFFETDYDCPDSFDDGIIVQAVMTGVCTSDVAMMQGKFGPLPFYMQGHEGLGQVIAVGKNVKTPVQVGDYVATRGEPAYADQYPVREGEFVVVPEAVPKYIIEPVACGINVIIGDLDEIDSRIYSKTDAKLLLIGSGFLAYVAYKTLKNLNINVSTDVVGRSNQSMWHAVGVELKGLPDKEYDVIINLKDSNAWLEQADIIANNGCLIDAVSRPVSKRESENFLWRSITTVRPSPRKAIFHTCMETAVEWIKSGQLEVDSFWTKGYNRQTEWQSAFGDSLNRPQHYSRGYIYWTNNGN